jgi:hypothetical protein
VKNSSDGKAGRPDPHPIPDPGVELQHKALLDQGVPAFAKSDGRFGGDVSMDP